MDISTPTLWWIAAGVAVAAELATGTFYLLMIALGLAAGAVAAHLSLAPTAQVIAAALIGGGATAVWHWRRFSQPQSAPARTNHDVNLDIGERLSVIAWADDDTTRVQYRGSAWTARLAPGAARVPGPHRIVAVEGNWLVLDPVAKN
jgi:membrane protein implicated in regulation of membrane protease activity